MWRACSRRAFALAGAALLAPGVAALVALAGPVPASAAAPAAVIAARPAKLLSSSAPAFPLHVSASKRYLVDSKGRPFLIMGDSPQALIVNLSTKAASSYFADRAAQGFNTVWINLLCDNYTGGRADGATYDGIVPFATPGDLWAPNPAYFARAESMIQLAAQHHLEVFLDPIETGGWLDVLEQNGANAAYGYGEYVGRLFRRFSNITWINGNDFQTWTNPTDDALVRAVARGIRATDPAALQTVELNYYVSTSLDDSTWSGLINLNAVYTYSPTYDEVLKAYNASPRMPAFLVESNYEGENDYRSPETLRRQVYWAILSGADGQIYGNKYVWPFAGGWQQHLDTRGSRQITFLMNLLSGLKWYDLVPDTKHRLVIAGYGDYDSSQDMNSNNYATAARTSNGKLAMAYLPSGNPIVVNLKDMSGPYIQGRWYDPTNGRYTSVHNSPLKRSVGKRRFVVPGVNSARGHDWVLVLSSVKQAPTIRTGNR